MRTLKSPGVEIVEVDLSQYAPSATGTCVLATGFANKGEDYTPIEMTSRSAFVNYFGEPQNEAERYFYSAAMEVINQNGYLWAAKLPYDNTSRDKYTYKKYTVGSLEENSLSTVSEYLNGNKNVNYFLDGNFSEFAFIDSGATSFNDAQKDFINYLKSTNTYGEWLQEYIVNRASKDVAFRLIWTNTPSPEDDNWIYYSQDNIYNRIYDFLSTLEDIYSEYHLTNNIPVTVLTSYNSLYNNIDSNITITFQVIEDYKTQHNCESYIEAFKKMYIDAFGEEATAFQPYYFVPSRFTGKIAEFLNANSEFFTAVVNYVDSLSNNIPEGVDKLPYLLFGQATNQLSGGEYNLMSYYTSIVDIENIKTNKIALENKVNNVVNYVTTLNDGISGQTGDLSTVFASTSTQLSTTGYEAIKNGLSNLDNVDLTAFVDFRDALNNYHSTPDYSARESIIKSYEVGPVSTQYTRDLIQYFIDNTLIESIYDQEIIRSGKTIAIFDKETGSYNESGTSVILDGKTFFTKYLQPEYESLEDYEQEFNKSISKDKLVEYINSSEETTEYNAIKDSATVQSLVGENGVLNTDKISKSLKLSEIKELDPTIKNVIEIKSDYTPSVLDMVTVDEYRTGESIVPPNNIYIVDISRGVYGKTADKEELECVGIIPVITTAANALQAQSLIETTTESSYEPYNSVDSVWNIKFDTLSSMSIPPESTAIPFSSSKPTDETLSKIANGYFNPIVLNSEGTLDREYLKDIGVVVFRAFIDPTEGNKVNYEVVESYTGSLDKDAKDPSTGATKFIDKIVNSQSDYINIFTNCFNTSGTRTDYQNTDILTIPPQEAATLGFYKEMAKKNISISESILKGLDLIFDKCSDINEKQIDIVVDAGISNIGQYIASVYGENGKGEYAPNSPEASLFKLKSRNNTLTWRSIIQKLDNFCKNIRKDCMFVADGLRPLCLTGNMKIVRPSKPSNTIDANIIPYVKYLTGLNTSYGACYLDWFQVSDDYSGELFWLPPSIKATGIYIYTDINAQFWDAPAGLNRGVVSAVDVAFSPTNTQAGSMYEKSFNYAINYPLDGIVLEGQKTLQSKPSAFDRVNVRRMFLRLERSVYQIARYFVYEPNNQYTRQRFLDIIDPIFSTVKNRGGIYDYKIICDDSNNTPTTIDNNELHVAIAIKPVKTIEFIICKFIALRTGGSFEEVNAVL